MGEYVGENKYARLRKQRERERKLAELRKWEFPQRIGSYNQYAQPALEFSKQICNNIFALDEAFSQETTTLKKNLLKLIHEKEFAPQVVSGNEPSLVLVLPDVICEYCQIAVDIDICRDPFINKEVGDKGSGTGGDWRCQHCDNQMNKGMIERRLVDLMNRRAVGYQLQDLKCLKCKMVKNSLVSRYCDCTGLYTQTIGNQAPEKLRNQNLLNNMTDIRLFLSLMRNFAVFH